MVSRLTRILYANLDIVVMVVVTSIIVPIVVQAELLDHHYSSHLGNGSWKADEWGSLILVYSLALTVLSIFRGRRLKKEIARREYSEAQASLLARHDPLTGLPNRRLLTEQLEQARVRTHGDGRRLAVLLIDLDRFKPINDLYGHPVGDRVLSEFAQRMLHLVEATPGALLARLGGDEFACVLEYRAGRDTPVRIANQIVHLAALPIDIGERMVEIGASVGIATAEGSAAGIEELLRMADVAMYRAKREGRGTFRSFEPQMDAELQLRAALETAMREGLPRGEFVPYYQPIMALPDNRLLGFEALDRWNHPERGLIQPDNFISIAEDCGLIGELCYSLLAHACADARNWPPNLTLSINISPHQLTDPWLATRLLQIAIAGGLAPGRLVVELTENSIVSDLEGARTIMASLQAAGIKVALDDFGTGYSSLAHLRELKFDSIKIDRSFVRDMAKSRDGELVRAIIGMGHSLGMPVTAEGVETEQDWSTLVDLDCNHAQGFLLGCPTSAAGALELVAKYADDGDADADERRVARGSR